MSEELQSLVQIIELYGKGRVGTGRRRGGVRNAAAGRGGAPHLLAAVGLLYHRRAGGWGNVPRHRLRPRRGHEPVRRQ